MGGLRGGRHRRTRALLASVVVMAALGAPATQVHIGPAAAIGDGAIDPTCTNVAANVLVSPGQNLAQLAQQHPAGTVFRLLPGLHRNPPVSPKAGQKFYGTYGPACERLSILSGARLITNWVADGKYFKATNHPEIVAPRNNECERGSDRCAHPHDLFVDNKVARHVPQLSSLRKGRSFFYDYATNTLWLGTPPAGSTVELSYSPVAFQASAGGVRVQGLIVEKYATQTQFGAVGSHTGAADWVIEDNEIRFNHGAGFALGPRSVARGNWVHDNGQIGGKMQGDRAIAIGNVITDNNYARVLRGWEAGGVKIRADDVQLIDNCIAYNNGNGLWVDNYSLRALSQGNVIFQNWGQGIHYEISDGGTIRNNRVGRNGTSYRWLYGAQIQVSTSSHTLVEGNSVEVAARRGNGLTVIWRNRPPQQGIGNVVRNNEVTFLGETGVVGIATDFAGGRAIYTQTTMTGNRYHVGGTAPFNHFAGPGGSRLELAQIQRSQLEQGSSLDTNVDQQTWRCSDFDWVTRR